MPIYKLILSKIALVLLVSLLIYFVIAILAAFVMLIIEALIHQMSLEIQEDSPSFQPWIIYIGMVLIMLLSFGIIIGLFLGYRVIKKWTNQRKRRATFETVVY